MEFSDSLDGYFQGITNMIYLLTNDGHRDSVNLLYYADNFDDMKKLLKKECSDLGEIIIEDTIKIDFNGRSIYYDYLDMFDRNSTPEQGKWGFIILERI